MNVRKVKAEEFAGKKLADHWDRLHEGDCEPCPTAAHLAALARKQSTVRAWLEQQHGPEAASERLLEAWREFHQGDFRAAIAAGEALGAPGITVANKAAGVLATYQEANESRALGLLQKAVASSYTARLLADTPLRRAQKVGEEGLETALAGACQGDASLLAESADLVFHLLVLLHGRNLDLGKLTAELERRHRDAAGARAEHS